MPPRLSLESLTARHELDEPAAAGAAATGGAARRLAGILDALGWQSASDTPASAVAPEIGMMIRACVRGHRQIATLQRSVAELLRRYSHPLDGSGTSVAAWAPFAAQLLDRYTGAPRAGAPVQSSGPG